MDDDGRPTLRILDRVSNMTELYVDGDSLWVEQARLECEVYGRSSAVHQVYQHTNTHIYTHTYTNTHSDDTKHPPLLM